MKITNRYDSTEILWEGDGANIREAVEKAIAQCADLRDADLRGAHLRGADLRDADLRGADLRDADLQGADLRDADLQGADLQGADLQGADLQGAQLRGADLRDADLRGADLRDSDLRDADLRGADLRDADLGDIPSIAGIDAAILAAIDQPGNSLDMSAWHTCETTHCRAGWAIHLAGAPGEALEDRFGPAVAGALIYAASGSYPVPNFQASNEEALIDMRKRAGL